MKKIVLVISAAFLMGACLPFSIPGIPTANVDVAATSAANLADSAAQTLTALPTNISLPPTETGTLLPTLPLEMSSTPTTAPTLNLSETATPLTATFEVPTSMDVVASATPVAAGTASVTPTLGVLTYGTLPPAIVPFTQITLINKSKRQAYISLQVVTEKGGPTIIEYPVRGRVKLKAPVGYYLYVAWVGGKQMVGEFRLHKDESLTIILYKDKVVIK